MAVWNSRADQLDVNITAMQWKLDAADLAEIDRIHAGDADAGPRFSLR